MAELTEQEVPKNSVFHPDNVNAVTLLTLLHIKDYLNVICGALDEDGTELVQKLHESGTFLCPPPLGPAASEPTGE